MSRLDVGFVFSCSYFLKCAIHWGQAARVYYLEEKKAIQSLNFIQFVVKKGCLLSLFTIVSNTRLKVEAGIRDYFH